MGACVRVRPACTMGTRAATAADDTASRCDSRDALRAAHKNGVKV